MKAIVYDRYGPPEVLHEADLPQPEPGPGEVLVRVRASSVTTADWRMRAAAYPGILWLPGRLMTGLTRPRNRVLGVEFAGEVAALGEGVSAPVQGTRVFGFSGKGAHAQYLVMPADGPIVETPATLSNEEAAALPFGALSALVFLRDFARIQPGQSVAVVGASGGVGIYAVQIARAMGATVTGIASGANRDLVLGLGAVQFIDYRAEDFTEGSVRYDLVFDAVGAVDFARARRVLKPGGLFLPLNFGFREMMQALWAKIAGGPRLKIGTSGDTAADLDVLKGMISEGKLRPMIDRTYPLEDIVEAHRYVEARHRQGAVVISVA
ncbi:NAD(P)-dependent alcohol dehydrogenase [Defluviimonas sp. SAOS-178_SWC]|uniref:NAD(P)-dependent alcohol dehydrogenase n=1 Tax=Defluviimonas sp. SAOS-178_SWC TaxID=3121287 RepID=UPI003221AAFD